MPLRGSVLALLMALGAATGTYTPAGGCGKCTNLRHDLGTDSASGEGPAGNFNVRRGFCAMNNWISNTGGLTVYDLLESHVDVSVEFEDANSDVVARYRLGWETPNPSKRCVVTKEMNQNVYYLDSAVYLWYQRDYLAPSVVVMMMDDLRVPHDEMRDPLSFGLDGLSRRRYPHAYTMIPVCGGARVSLATSTHPMRQACPKAPLQTPLSYSTRFEGTGSTSENLRNWMSEMTDRGHKVASFGKVFHDTRDNDAATASDLAETHFPKHDKAPWCATENDDCAACEFSMSVRGEAATDDGPRPNYFTGETSTSDVAGACDDAIDQLVEDDAINYVQNNHGFFAVVGFLKPHLPLVVDAASIAAVETEVAALADPPDVIGEPYPVEAPVNYELLGNGPKYTDVSIFYEKYGPDSWAGGQECISNANSGTGDYCYDPGQRASTAADVNALPDETGDNMRKFYYASVYETMQRVHRVTAAIRASNPNTLILFGTDHGFSLGEHAFYCKHRMYRTDVSIPVELSIPMAQFASLPAQATDVDEVVSLLDFPPTAFEWMGYPMKACGPNDGYTTPFCADGRSLLPSSAQLFGSDSNLDTRVFRDSGLVGRAAPDYVYSVYPRQDWSNGGVTIYGHTLLGKDVRLTYWSSLANDGTEGLTPTLAASESANVELYYWDSDPNEMNNVFNPNNQAHRALVDELRALLVVAKCPFDSPPSPPTPPRVPCVYCPDEPDPYMISQGYTCDGDTSWEWGIADCMRCANGGSEWVANEYCKRSCSGGACAYDDTVCCPPAPPSPPPGQGPCQVCTDEEDSYMLSQGHTCESWSWGIDQCNRCANGNSDWTTSKYCEHSCFFASAGCAYSGSNCCPPPPPAPNCEVCSDEADPWMLSNGYSCEDWTWGIDQCNRCANNDNWNSNQYCKHSCFFASAGCAYAGTTCCPPSPPPACRACTNERSDYMVDEDKYCETWGYLTTMCADANFKQDNKCELSCDLLGLGYDASAPCCIPPPPAPPAPPATCTLKDARDLLTLPDVDCTTLSASECTSHYALHPGESSVLYRCWLDGDTCKNGNQLSCAWECSSCTAWTQTGNGMWFGGSNAADCCKWVGTQWTAVYQPMVATLSCSFCSTTVRLLQKAGAQASGSSTASASSRQCANLDSEDSCKMAYARTTDGATTELTLCKWDGGACVEEPASKTDVTDCALDVSESDDEGKWWGTAVALGGGVGVFFFALFAVSRSWARSKPPQTAEKKQASGKWVTVTTPKSERRTSGASGGGDAAGARTAAAGAPATSTRSPAPSSAGAPAAPDADGKYFPSI